MSSYQDLETSSATYANSRVDDRDMLVVNRSFTISTSKKPK